jgi:hypothetical protein
MHFQTWQDKAGNAPPLTDPTNGLVFPDLNSPPFGGEDFQTNLIMPEPCPFLSRKFPVCSIIRPTETNGAATGLLLSWLRQDFSKANRKGSSIHCSRWPMKRMMLNRKAIE